MEGPQSIRREPSDGSLDLKSPIDTTTAKTALLDHTENKTRKISLNPHSSCMALDWRWELLAWATSLLSLCTVVGILLAFNHKALSEWPYRIKLNTLVSVFAQISSTTLTIPLSECISQLKWLWFTRHNQPLSDFDSFDKASRGPWSSFLLIWKTRASHLVSFGALLVLANLAFQAFVQQTLSFPQRMVPSELVASVQTIHNLTEDGLQGGFIYAEKKYGGYVPPSTVASVYAGLNGGVDLSQVTATCPTGNCTWEPYESLALCANPVANLTHLLKNEAVGCSPNYLEQEQGLNSCNYSLPNGVYLAEDLFMNVTSLPLNGTHFAGYIPPSNHRSIAFSNISVVLDFFVIYMSTTTNNFAAMEASLSFCGKTYNTSTINGKTVTVEIDRWGTLEKSNADIWPIVGNSTTLWVAQAYMSSIQATLASIFTGYYEIGVGGMQAFSSVAPQALNNTLAGSGDDVATLQSFMDEIAVSISNNLRTGAGSVPVHGLSHSVETYVSVDWFWLIFPSFIVFLTLVFLAATMARNSGQRTKTWKSSILAALGGLSNDAKAKIGDLTSLASIQERAKGVRVRLVEDHGQWQLAAER